MRKGRALSALLIAFMLILSSCGNGPTASDRAIINAKNAISIGEKYLSGDVTGDDAYEQISEVKANLEYASKYTREEKSDDETKSADSYLYSYTFYLQLSILLDKGPQGDAESFKKVQEAVKDLKEQLSKYD